jgi:hypothetical protein
MTLGATLRRIAPQGSGPSTSRAAPRSEAMELGMALDNAQIIRTAHKVAEHKDIPGWAACFTEVGSVRLDPGWGNCPCVRDVVPRRSSKTWRVRGVAGRRPALPSRDFGGPVHSRDRRCRAPLRQPFDQGEQVQCTPQPAPPPGRRDEPACDRPWPMVCGAAHSVGTRDYCLDSSHDSPRSGAPMGLSVACR